MTAKTVRDALEQNQEKMFAGLPKHITPERMIRVALTCIQRNPKLLLCTESSLYGAIVEAATLGLETDGILGQAYLVPYGKTCTLIPGYKGLIALARRSGEISTIQMEVVREGDEWNYVLGIRADLHHRPNDADPDREKKPITHVYCVVKLKDGGVQFKVWTAAKINAHKEKYSKGWQWAETGKGRSGSKKDSPWHTDWEVMAKKTVIRDMIQRGEIPVSIEIQKLAAVDDLHERRPVDEYAVPEASLTLDSLTNQMETANSEPDNVVDATKVDPPTDVVQDLPDWGKVDEEMKAATNSQAVDKVYDKHEMAVPDPKIWKLKALRQKAFIQEFLSDSEQ